MLSLLPPQKRYLEGNGDIKYCPRCDTPAIIEPGRAGGAELGQCPKCMHVFCSRCRLGDHRGETCAQALMREGAEVEERLERELQVRRWGRRRGS